MIGEKIWVVAVTGGPCSGKTTGLSRISQRLSDRGYKVLVSPETASKLILAGMKPGELPNIHFQQQILLDVLAQEERMVSIAKCYRDYGQRVVILCDRGTMDGQAYCGQEEFRALIHRLGLNPRNICEERYHAVIHLRTAAIGAEQFYSLKNNPARREADLEEARALDQKTLDAWTRHPHPRVIDNSTNFDTKLHRLFVEICNVLGDPIPLEHEDKFLIGPVIPSTLPVDYHTSFIVQDYLVSPEPDVERRVRSRSDLYGMSYYYTIKRPVSRGVRQEEERMISEQEYHTLRTLRDQHTKTIVKNRICFFWKEQFFEIDSFEKTNSGLTVMEVERSDNFSTIDLPPFITVFRNVTDDKQFSNRELARTL